MASPRILAVRAALALEPRSWHCCQGTFFEVRSQSSLTRSPVSSEVWNSRAARWGVSQDLDRRSDSSALSGSLTHLYATRPSKSCVLGVGTRSQCVFQLPDYPQRFGGGPCFRPRIEGVSPSGAYSGWEAGVRDPSQKDAVEMLVEPSGGTRQNGRKTVDSEP